MKLAIKKPEAVSWKTDLSFEDIQKMRQAGKITEEWLVCLAPAKSHCRRFVACEWVGS
jgi:hypothetical protein